MEAGFNNPVSSIISCDPCRCCDGVRVLTSSSSSLAGRKTGLGGGPFFGPSAALDPTRMDFRPFLTVPHFGQNNVCSGISVEQTEHVCPGAPWACAEAMGARLLAPRLFSGLGSSGGAAPFGFFLGNILPISA